MRRLETSLALLLCTELVCWKWNGRSAVHLIGGFPCLTPDDRSSRWDTQRVVWLPAALAVSERLPSALERCRCGASCWCQNTLSDSINKLLQRPSLASLLSVTADKCALRVLKNKREYTTWSCCWTCVDVHCDTLLKQNNIIVLILCKHLKHSSNTLVCRPNAEYSTYHTI